MSANPSVMRKNELFRNLILSKFRGGDVFQNDGFTDISTKFPVFSVCIFITAENRTAENDIIELLGLHNRKTVTLWIQNGTTISS